MLEFSAAKYISIAHKFGILLGQHTGKGLAPSEFGDVINDIFSDAKALGLEVTRTHLSSMLLEIMKEQPSKVRLHQNGLIEIKGATLDAARLCHHVESVYKTLCVEMGAILFKAVPMDRKGYADGSWLKAPAISKFPTSLKELERAGQCYALGQPTASVFHSMRALEPGLGALAKPFNVSSAHENWQNVINDIEAKIRSLGNQPKSPQKIDDEKFFGNAISHLYFVKNAWRNHVAHTRESYSDDEALKVLRHSAEFIESLSAKLAE